MMHMARFGKRIIIVAMGAGLLGFVNCLGLDLDRALRFGAAYSAAELLFDNDSSPLSGFGFGDLFEGGSTAPNN